MRTVMKDAGTAMMGIGLAAGDNRAVEAAIQAISSKLLESSINGANRILVSVAGASDMTLIEVSEAADAVTEAADPEATIIFGSVIDDTLVDQVRVTVIATGFGDRNQQSVLEFDDSGFNRAGNGAELSFSARPRSRNASTFDDDIPDFLKRGF